MNEPLPRRSLKCLLYLIEMRNQARLCDLRARRELGTVRQEAHNAEVARIHAENALKEYMEDADPPPNRCAYPGCGVVLRNGATHCFMHAIKMRFAVAPDADPGVAVPLTPAPPKERNAAAA